MKYDCLVMANHSTRRDFLAASLALPALGAAEAAGTHQASGVKVGEITSRAVRIWSRRTKASARRADGAQALRGTTRARVLPLGTDLGTLEGSCPGEAGQLRLILKTADGKRVHQTPWITVGPTTDFTHQFRFEDLKADTAYGYTIETRASSKTDGSLQGVFRTAPPEDVVAPVNLAMLSCQKYSQRDDDNGFFLYDAIRQWSPNFYLSVGDNVYYDSDDPKVNHIDVARFHWHRMFSLSRIVECSRAVPAYFLKDDHDCYSDDCFPTYVNETMNPFTFDEGRRIFPEQVPMGDKPYRRFRWGRALEIFLLEGRDYRTANPDPDGPKKSIWGPEQRRWLEQGLTMSQAHWKLIVSPTPLVGPDRPTKRDNHSNAVYAHEGGEFRSWLQKNTRNDTFVLCGDRHWQYHSVEPETKVNEFGCGAASDSHASGTPGENKNYHRFHRVMGGFLAIQVQPQGSTSKMVIEHRDVRGKAVYRQEFEKKS